MGIKNCCDSSGNCSRCGNCCAALLPFTRKEEKRIREYIKENNIKPSSFNNGQIINLNCCFYDIENKICKIYEVRPKICRTFKCNRNFSVLLKERDNNQSKAYWNQIVDNLPKNLTDMRLLFYGDPRSLVGNIIYTVTNGNMECNVEQFEVVKKMLRNGGQEELVNCMEVEFKNYNEIKRKDN